MTSYQYLKEDIELYEANQTSEDLKDALKDAISRRKTTIENLKYLKNEVEERYDKSKKAQIGGTVATVTGSALGIVGFGLGFVTFGAGFGLGTAGAALAAAGGATIAGSQVVYQLKSSTNYKNAQQAAERDQEYAAKIERYGKKLNDHLDSLAKKHGTTKEGIMKYFQELKKHGQLAKNVRSFVYNATRAADVIGDGIRVTQKAITAGKSAAAAAATTTRVTVTTVKSVAGIIRIGGVVLDVVLIPIDLGVMAKAAYDVHKYRKKGLSNSTIAKDIGNLITVLTENLYQMETFLQTITAEQ